MIMILSEKRSREKRLVRFQCGPFTWWLPAGSFDFSWLGRRHVLSRFVLFFSIDIRSRKRLDPMSVLKAFGCRKMFSVCTHKSMEERSMG